MKFEDGVHVFESMPPFLPVNLWGTAGTGGFVLGSTNQALLFPLWVPVAFKTNKAVIYVVTQSGNIDIGLYDKNGNRVVSTGSVACPAAGRQELSLSSTILLPKLGPYYIAYAANNITVSLGSWRNQANELFRPMIFNTSFALPSTLTLGSPSSRGTFRPAILLVNQDFSVAP